MYPALIMAYLGQGAQLIVNGENVISNVFYATIPGGAGKPLYWSVAMQVLDIEYIDMLIGLFMWSPSSQR